MGRPLEIDVLRSKETVLKERVIVMEHTVGEQQQATKMRLALPIVAVVLLVAAIIAGLVFANREHARAAQRFALKTQLASLNAARDTISSTLKTLNANWTKYESLETEANAAGLKRHDNSVSESPDSSFMYDEAKLEHADVLRMQSTESDLDSNYEQIADTFAGTLGSSPVTTLRSHIRAANEAEQNALSNWERAISDIKDALQRDVEGGYGSASDSDDGLYEASNEDENRANTNWTNAKNDLATLARALRARINDTQSKIAHL